MESRLRTHRRVRLCPCEISPLCCLQGHTSSPHQISLWKSAQRSFSHLPEPSRNYQALLLLGRKPVSCGANVEDCLKNQYSSLWIGRYYGDIIMFRCCHFHYYSFFYMIVIQKWVKPQELSGVQTFVHILIINSTVGSFQLCRNRKLI